MKTKVHRAQGSNHVPLCGSKQRALGDLGEMASLRADPAIGCPMQDGAGETHSPCFCRCEMGCLDISG